MDWATERLRLDVVVKVRAMSLGADSALAWKSARSLRGSRDVTKAGGEAGSTAVPAPLQVRVLPPLGAVCAVGDHVTARLRSRLLCSDLHQGGS